MKITIVIDTSNTIFEDSDEVENILQKVGERITSGWYECNDKEYAIFEMYGNPCGSVKLTPDQKTGA